MMRHTQQRAQRFLLQKLYFHISLRRNGSLLAWSLGAIFVSLPLLLGHCVRCTLGTVISVVGVAVKKVPRIGRIPA